MATPRMHRFSWCSRMYRWLARPASLGLALPQQTHNTFGYVVSHALCLFMWLALNIFEQIVAVDCDCFLHCWDLLTFGTEFYSSAMN
mmetsp:Transcript_132752/g.216199  ORF Transcript_132752/g.216199 Transcript_132752/m.216199 type:complete len:87 (+) Transcript_132752:1877-2137(+)